MTTPLSEGVLADPISGKRPSTNKADIAGPARCYVVVDRSVERGRARDQARAGLALQHMVTPSARVVEALEDAAAICAVIHVDATTGCQMPSPRCAGSRAPGYRWDSEAGSPSYWMLRYVMKSSSCLDREASGWDCVGAGVVITS